MNDLQEVIIMDDDVRGKLDTLATKVFGQALAALSDTQKRDLISLDMGMMATQLTVSASETRTTEAKFNTNNYMGSCNIDMKGAADYVSQALANTPDNELIARYLELKSTLLNMYRIKWEGHEHFLRSLLRAAQEKDGILGLGRYKK